MSGTVVSLHGTLLAEFDRPEAARHAYVELRERGYVRLDSYSPFPLTTDQARRPGAWPALAIVVVAAAFAGGVSAYLVQWFANVRSYALDLGGRPAHALPAFVPVTFEAVVLLAGVTTVVGMLIALRLPRLWRPELEIGGFERSSRDRYWVVVGLGSGGGDPARTTRELRSLGAVRVVHLAREP